MGFQLSATYTKEQLTPWARDTDWPPTGRAGLPHTILTRFPGTRAPDLCTRLAHTNSTGTLGTPENDS